MLRLIRGVSAENGLKMEILPVPKFVYLFINAVFLWITCVTFKLTLCS
jgi:hypothetical protein